MLPVLHRNRCSADKTRVNTFLLLINSFIKNNSSHIPCLPKEQKRTFRSCRLRMPCVTDRSHGTLRTRETMVVRKRLQPKTLILTVSVAAVQGHRPIVGSSEQVEEILSQLKKEKIFRGKLESTNEPCWKRHNVRQEERDQQAEATKQLKMNIRKGSNSAALFNKFKQLDQASQAAEASDVFNKNWKPPKFDKNAEDYGRPQKGSLTEKRGVKAGHHVGKEIIQLCEVIDQYGKEQEDDTIVISFGELFSVYQYISDKVVGILLRARKHKLVDFEGEMLYQRRDELKSVVLLKSVAEVRQLYEQSDDPAYCLSR